MRIEACRNFLIGAAALTALAIFAGHGLGANHHELNGTWQLMPEQSEFHGEAAIQTGSVTIEDREGNVYVSRNFDFDHADGSRSSTAFETDARRGTSIKEPGFSSKAEWKGDVLQVVTKRDGAATIEHYSLGPNGTMVLGVDRPEHAHETLLFERR